MHPLPGCIRTILWETSDKRSICKTDSTKITECHQLTDLCMQPLASSRGRGIKLVPNPDSIAADKACLVQHYISNPHTINGLKVHCALVMANGLPCHVLCHVPVLLCPALPYPDWPHLAPPRPALPSPALPCPALSCPALPRPALPRPALPDLPGHECTCMQPCLIQVHIQRMLAPRCQLHSHIHNMHAQQQSADKLCCMCSMI